MCCIVLQRIAECCSTLQCVAVRHKVLKSCNDNGSEEVCCSVLQRVAASCSVSIIWICIWTPRVTSTTRIFAPIVCIATHCNTLQHTSTHCNTLQHTLFYIDDVHICMRVYTLCLTDCMYTYMHSICCMGQHQFAVCCSVLQCVAVCCSVLQCVSYHEISSDNDE